MVQAYSHQCHRFQGTKHPCQWTVCMAFAYWHRRPQKHDNLQATWSRQFNLYHRVLNKIDILSLHILFEKVGLIS